MNSKKISVTDRQKSSKQQFVAKKCKNPRKLLKNKMNLIIGSKAIKIFIKALKFLAKFNPEYIIIAKDNKLHIKAVCKNQVSASFMIF